MDDGQGSHQEPAPPSSGELLPLVYEQLRQLAEKAMASERAAHTLQPTALVHEAFLRLAGSDVRWRDERHFYAVAVGVIRRVLVDHARARTTAKRDPKGARVLLESGELAAADASGSGALDVLALDE